MGESWRWQLRDSEGQWVRMGSRVKWLFRGRTLRGTVVGSPRQNVATIKPDGGGSNKDIDVRRITVDTPTHAERTGTVSVPPEVHAGERHTVRPTSLKVGDWVDLPAEDALKPMDPNWGKVHHPAFVGQVTKIDPRGKGWIITVTGEGKNKRAIPATKMFPPLVKITVVQPKSDAGIGRPTRVAKAKVDIPAAVKPTPEEQRRQWWLERTGSPGPTGTPEQIEALSPENESLSLKDRLRAFENKRRDLLAIAAEAKPGTHVWRGETLDVSPQEAASTGIHWSVNPSQVVTKASDMIRPDQTDVIWHGVVEEDTQGVPRSHPMWRGLHRSMDSEAEVRLRPGTHIRVIGVRVGGEYHKVDRRLVVENKGTLQYKDVPDFAVQALTDVPAAKEYPPLTDILKRSAEIQRAAALLRDPEVSTPAVTTPPSPQGIMEAKGGGDVPRIRIIGHDEDSQPVDVRTPASEPLVWTQPFPGTYEAPGFKLNRVGSKWTVTVTDEFGQEEVYSAGYNLKEAKEFAERTHREQTPSPQGTMEAEEVVKVKDAQPEAKSPAVQAAEKKALAVDTDTQLAKNYEARWGLRIKHERTAHTVQRSSGSKKTSGRYVEKETWDRSIDDALTDFQGPAWERANWERSVAEYNAETAQLKVLDAEAARLNTIYTEAGGWPRAFLVTNQGGHVHRSMSCSTCRPTTRFHWLPEYSGSDENQIVEDAGERACTVCYPSAPVDILKRATKIFSEDEKQQQVERERAKVQRDAAKVAKAAKALTMPDGSEIRAGYFRDSLRTEVSARQWYVKNAAELIAKQKPEQDIPVTTESLEKILVALAAKHSKTVEEIRAEMEAKVRAKVKQIT